MNEFVAYHDLVTDEYARERLTPSLTDGYYLHLSDLKLALESVLPPPDSIVLDYGCGGSPYRSLFHTERYYRADIPGTKDVDFVFGADSRLPVDDACYDCVLSTQVLEHVEHSDAYLQECRRVLRPGGCLLLTTHGVFNDHGCPFDFRRWTAAGLRTDLKSAGLNVTQIRKLTTGPRALIFLNQQFQPQLLFTERSLVAWMLRLSRLPYTRLQRRWLNEIADRQYAHCRVVPESLQGHDLYIALLAVATRAG